MLDNGLLISEINIGFAEDHLKCAMLLIKISPEFSAKFFVDRADFLACIRSLELFHQLRKKMKFDVQIWNICVKYASHL